MELLQFFGVSDGWYSGSSPVLKNLGVGSFCLGACVVSVLRLEGDLH